MNWLIQRVRDIVHGAYPKERLVCLAAFSIRVVFILAPAIAAWEYLPWPWWGRAPLAWATGWAGAFVWADLGPEELFTKVFTGYANNYNMTPLGRLEGFCGAVDKRDLPEWEGLKGVSLRPWDGTYFE